MILATFNGLWDIIRIPFGWLLAFLYDLTSNYGVALIIFAVALLGGCGENTGADTHGTTDAGAEPLPDGFDAEKVKAEPYTDLPEISVWESGENEFYVYIKAWNAYRIISVSSTLSSGGYGTAFGNTCAVVGESTATLALYNHDFVDVEATVYTFKRNDQNTEVYQGKFHAGGHFYECPDAFLNVPSVNEVYLFYTVEDPNSAYVKFMRVDTEDGGKTWTEPTETGVGTSLKESPTDIMEFLTHEIGIIGYRCCYTSDLSDRTCLTFDGGKTWERMGELPYPGKIFEAIANDDAYGYSEIRDFTLTEDGYLLTVRVQNSTADTSDIIYFASEDLKNWRFVAFENYDSVISIYRKIVELCPRYPYEPVETNNYFGLTYENGLGYYDLMFYSTFTLYPRNDGFDGLDGNCYERFGYSVSDINGEGIEELILYVDDIIISVFTEKDGKPFMLGNYWNRSSCRVTKDGYLYVAGGSGADRGSSEIYKIDEYTAELVMIYGWGTDGYDAEKGTVKYYKMKDGQMTYISEVEYNEWVANCPYDLSKNENIEIIPIFDDEHPAPPPFVAPPDKG